MKLSLSESKGFFGAEKHLKKHKIQRSKNTKKVRGNKNE